MNMASTHLNKTNALKAESFIEGDIDDDFLERFAEETGWKSALPYQYLSGYIVMVAITALLASAIAWIEMMHLIITPDMEPGVLSGYIDMLWYLFDFMYVVDIVFRILYAVTKWPNKKLYNEPVPIEFIVVDILSVIPYDLLYAAVVYNPLIKSILRLRVMLRLYRVATTLGQLRKMFQELSIMTSICWSTSLMLLAMIIPASIHYIFYCKLFMGNCTSQDYGAFMKTYSTTSQLLMTSGADVISQKVEYMYHVYSCLSIIYCVAATFIVAALSCRSIDHIKPRYGFIDEYQRTMKLYKGMKTRYKMSWTFEDDQIYFTLKDYYYHYLHQRNGISAPTVLNKILPPSLTKSIIMDIAYDSFRHSHIFRSLELNIVRFLSTLVRFEFAVPGEVLARKGDKFNKMIYISHGVLQILSHEDGETPVLNLSGGTSLGETTLFVPYPLNCTIICQTYCELVIIDQSGLNKMTEYYPSEYRVLIKTIMDRFEEAKKLRGIVHERMDPHLIKSDLLVMSWIKQFQRCFLHDRENEGTSLDSKIRGLQYYIDNLIFYVPYLDKLVVSEEIELVKDSVFLKATYHFILQPQSPMLMVWNLVVLILTLLFIIIYPFNLCYPDNTNRNIQAMFTICITFIFWIDIYLQIFTAVKTRGATYLTFKTILVYRIRQSAFFIDCFAALPLEYFILFLSGNTANVTFLLLQSNRLLKYYKIICFFDNLNVWSTGRLTAFNYIKYIMHFLFLYYYATMITYILNCFQDVCTKDFKEMLSSMLVNDYIGKLLATLPLSNALVSGVILGEMPIHDSAFVYFGYTTVAVCAYLLKTLFVVNVISTSAVQNFSLLKEQEHFLGIAEALEWFEVSKSYKIGISEYMNTLFYFKDSDIFTHFNKMELPIELGVLFRNTHLTRLLGKNKFFEGIPKNHLSFLSATVKMVIIPAGLVVFYCGQAIDECYVISEGFCTMWYGSVNRDVTINENLGLVEVLLDVPIFHTVVTHSDCILMKFTKHDLHRFFSQFGNQARIINSALGEFEKCEHLLSRNVKNFDKNPLETYKDVMKIRRRRHKADRVALNEKFFLRRYQILKTIPTTSRLLLYWEITKTIAWVLSLASRALLPIGDKLIRRGILSFLDSFSMADIIIRMFITYFDNNGLEITKFLKVSLHYFSHAFIIDLISVFPFDLFVEEDDIVIARFNRYLQSYRILGLAYYSTTRIKKVHHYFYIAHLIIFLLFTENLASCYVEKMCTTVLLDGNYFTECYDDSWTKLSINKVEMYQVYSETYLLLLSVFFGIGFRRYIITNFWERLILSIWGIVGNLTVVIILGRAVSYYMFRNADLTTYQEAMKDLVRFLSYCDIDKNIKHEVIQHFEYIWEKRQGKNIAKVIGNFPTSVKKDVLFNIYGKYLRKSISVFNYAEDNFLKSLLMIVKQETFRKTGIIYKVDDIHGTIFFLLKGSVEVVGPDTNRLLTLSVGSLFGCLDDCKECRQTLTMVANGHVETLAFSSQEFYELLLQHPKFRTRFMNMANMQFDFIKSYTLSEQKEMPNRISRGNTVPSKFLFVRKMRTKIMKPSIHLKRMEIALFVIEFFLGTMYELMLRVIVSDMPFWMIAYVRDLFWILRMYFKFHVAYEDEFGMLEYNRKKIARRYLRQKSGFYFDLICILPLDCLTFAVTTDNLRNKLFLFFRLNRFLRCFYLFRHMSRKTKKLNINVLLMRTAYILMYAYIYIEVKFIAYYWAETVLEPVNASNWQRILRALDYFDTILFIFTKAPVPYTDYYDNWAPWVLSVIIYLDACFLVFFVSCFAGTLQIATKVKSKYLNVCHNLKLLMLICDASNPLIEKIQLYTNILLRIRNGVQFPFLLEHAPFYLREAVLNSMFGFHLRNHYLFKDCHIDFLRQLSATMRTLTYFEGNHICNKGDIDETMYFIQEGVVQALTKDTLYTEVCEHLLIAGESFGLNQILYPRCGQYYAYRASILTTLVTINRHEFIRLLTFFPSAKKHIFNRTIEFAS